MTAGGGEENAGATYPGGAAGVALGPGAALGAAGAGAAAVNAGSGAGVNGGALPVGSALGAPDGGGAGCPEGAGPGLPGFAGAWACATLASRHPAPRKATDQRAREAAHIYCYWATVANAMPRNIVEARMASCYRDRVSVKRAGAVIAVLVGVLCAAAFTGCSRTGLLDLDSVTSDGNPTNGADAGGPPMFRAVVDAGPDAVAAPPPPPARKPPPPVTTPPKRCTPHPEICNGVDDDCDGEIDQGLPAVPCAGGGEQYCIAGRLSACPVRCEACLPGSERVCFLSYCTYWATQTCASDGRSFGVCREKHVPSECEDVARANKDSAALEQCCIDKGYCCRDEYDLDHDGDSHEMLGSCDEVSCH